ncbi:flagellar operon protein [Malonomonas rubra DSM 5091]|uniref:Flagellar operon protein n=1 Tax=Malonomonas rubra DSM 5091 TaxID=1122189 RepID=A0A1M6MCL4_MALRU|nr:TIGR02530 family flagellar biosynthesis protein [Malonomonas rubra]SHJ81181.1 flagellar operon protein [Malonomonas rubra DSM 5091]
MTDRITIIPQPITPNRGKPAARPQQSPAGGSFEQLLNRQIDQQGVKFSRHAVDRMNSRGINFNSSQMQRLEQAVSQVEAKGGKDSLVMLDDTALVVSVKNETVVTVVDKGQLKNNVFTNIDSAVIA